MPVSSQTLVRPRAGLRLVVPAPLDRFGGYVRILVAVFQEAREMQRQAHTRWPFLEE